MRSLEPVDHGRVQDQGRGRASLPWGRPYGAAFAANRRTQLDRGSPSGRHYAQRESRLLGRPSAQPRDDFHARHVGARMVRWLDDTVREGPHGDVHLHAGAHQRPVDHDHRLEPSVRAGTRACRTHGCGRASALSVHKRPQAANSARCQRVGHVRSCLGGCGAVVPGTRRPAPPTSAAR